MHIFHVIMSLEVMRQLRNIIPELYCIYILMYSVTMILDVLFYENSTVYVFRHPGNGTLEVIEFKEGLTTFHYWDVNLLV